MAQAEKAPPGTRRLGEKLKHRIEFASWIKRRMRAFEQRAQGVYVWGLTHARWFGVGRA